MQGVGTATAQDASSRHHHTSSRQYCSPTPTQHSHNTSSAVSSLHHPNHRNLLATTTGSILFSSLPCCTSDRALKSECTTLIQNPLSSHILSKMQSSKYTELFLSYGCQTWSLSIQVQYRFRMSENKMLKRIFTPRM